MSFDKVFDPLTQSIWRLLIVLWPLWLVLAILVLMRLIVDIHHQRRLAKAGIFEIDKMDGITFERYLEVMFRKLGYTSERTQASGDFGADLILSKDSTRIIVQAKRYQKNVGVKAVQEVVAAQKMYNGAKAMVVTNSGYTRQARHLAQVNNVELWDREHLITAILSTQKNKQKNRNSE